MRKRTNVLKTAAALVILTSMILGILLPVVIVKAQADWLSGWGYRIEITIDNTNIDSDLTHFPVPIKLGVNVGQGNDDLTPVFDEVGANYQKIAVTKSDGITELFVEVDYWDETNEKALLWVSKSDWTLTSGSATTIYLYFDGAHVDNTDFVASSGNRPEVWHSMYQARFGMSQDPSGTAPQLIDSTNNNHDGTSYGTMTTSDLVDGELGKAIDFDGVDDHFQLARPIEDDWTIEVKLKAISGRTDTYWYGNSGIVGREVGGVTDDYGLMLNGGQFRAGIGNPDRQCNTSISYNDGNWYTVLYERDKSAGDIFVYVDNSQKCSHLDTSTTTKDAAADIAIGGWVYEVEAVIEEVRMANQRYTAAWRKASYHSMEDNLIDAGSVEEVSGEISVMGNGIEIVDGDTTPSADDNTDFGESFLAATVTKSFTIANEGDAGLNLTGDPKVDITGTHAGDFTVTQAPTSPVAGGDQTTFDVTFDPGDEGVRTATISIANDDSDENPYTFDIQGTGVSVNMGESSVTVPAGVVSAVETRLNNYLPDTSANMWAITDYSETATEGYYYFGLLGLIVDDPDDPKWSLEKGVWTGVGIVRDDGGGSYTAGIEGDGGTYDTLIGEAEVTDPAYQATGGGGSPYYTFPWQAGTLAWYGVKGVHGAGPYGDDPYADYVAVDFVGGSVGYADNIMPNAVFASETGTVNFVCRDDYQVWVGVGNFLYGHLVDNENLHIGHRFTQGENMGAMTTGPLDTAWEGCYCGNAEQRSTSYHLHFGFKPDGNYFQIEKWTLNIDDETWRYGNDSVAPQDYLKAEWSGGPIIYNTPTPGGPTPTPGGAPTPYPEVPPEGGGGAHIYDPFVNAMESMVQERVDSMDDVTSGEEERNIPIMIASGFRVAIRTVYVLMVSNLNMTITIIIFGLIVIMENVRILRAIWMGIKELIPFVG